MDQTVNEQIQQKFSADVINNLQNMLEVTYSYFPETKEYDLERICSERGFDLNTVYLFCRFLFHLNLIKKKIIPSRRSGVPLYISYYINKIKDGATIDDCIYELHSNYTIPFYNVYRKILKDVYPEVKDLNFDNIDYKKFITEKYFGFNELDARMIYLIYQNFKTGASINNDAVINGSSTENMEAGLEEVNTNADKLFVSKPRNTESFKSFNEAINDFVENELNDSPYEF